MNVQLPNRDEELYDDDDMNQELGQLIEAYGQQRSWKQDFISLGGFTHLLNCLINLPLQEIRSSLELKVIKTLVQVIFKFVNHARELTQLQQQEKQGQEVDAADPTLLEAQGSQLTNACVLKAIGLVDAICKYSIAQEKARGESIEQI